MSVPGVVRRVGGVSSRVGFVASAVTTVCCLGVASAISVASAIGATFLTRDSTLQPLLIAMLSITVAGSAWTALRHRSVLPLLLTVVASVLVYSALYGPLDGGIGVTGASASGHSDHGAMHDAMTEAPGSHGGISSRVLVWIGLAVLLLAQLWDVRRGRRCAVPRTTDQTDATSNPSGPPGVVPRRPAAGSVGQQR